MDNEDVRYSFTGDVSSLRKATEQAISLLNRFSKQITSIANNSALGQNSKVVRMLDSVRSKSQQLQNTMSSLKNRVSNVFDPMASRLNQLKGPFALITRSVQSFRDKAANAFNRVSHLVSTCASAFRRVQQSEDGASGAASRASQTHKGLSTIFEKLRNTLKRGTDALSRLGSMFRKESSNVNSFSSNMKLLKRVTDLARRGLLSLTGIRLGDWLASAVKESINFVENLNLFNVAMGESVDRGHEFVSTMSELYGMDPSNLYRYAGYFYQLTDAIGMADGASAVLSLSLTKASNDLASLFNVDIETVVNNLSSGMQGMTRAVRKYGIDIRMTTLQQTALTYGITEQVETMSEANRQALRFITMMNQVRNATKQVVETADGATEVVGDFARTIESPANQLRVFKEQITQLGRAIGNFFIPTLQAVLPLVNGFIMALRTVLTFIATIGGFISDFGGSAKGLDSSAEAVEGIGTAAADTTKKLKNLLGPFDELNVLSQNTDSSGGGSGIVSDDVLDPALAEAIAGMELNLENIRMKANDVRDALLQFFGFEYTEVFNPETGNYESQIQWMANTFHDNLIAKFPQWSKTINALFDNWSNNTRAFKGLLSSVGGVFDRVKEKAKAFIDSLELDEAFSQGIGKFADSLDRISSWLDRNADKLASIVFTVTSIAVAFKALSFVSSLISMLGTVLGPVMSAIGGVSSAASSLSTTLGAAAGPVALIVAGVLALVAALVYLWNTSDSFRESVIAGVQTLIDVLLAFWDDLLKPVLENIWNSLVNLWQEAIKPVIEKVIDIIGSLVELIMALWNNILAPLVEWVVHSLGPAIAGIFNDIWNVILTVISNIIGVIEGLLQVLDGVIDFLVGIFTGDWERAWHGLVNIFVGIGNTLISVFELIMNAIIGLINAGISVIFNGIKGFINAALGLVDGIANLVGLDIDVRMNASAPQIPTVSIPRIPEMANGGVVRSPTLAMIGEGRYDEAVVPLGNSPQMHEFAQAVADAVTNRSNGPTQPIHVHVYIGNEELDEYIHSSTVRRDLQTNGG